MIVNPGVVVNQCGDVDRHHLETGSPWPPLRSRTETAGGRVENLIETQVLHVMAITHNTLKRLAVVSACGTAVFAAGLIIYECHGILKSIRSLRAANQQPQVDRINQLEAEFTQATNALANRQGVITEQAARIREANATVGTLRAQIVVVTNDRDILQAGENGLAQRITQFETSCTEREATLREQRRTLERDSDALDLLVAEANAEKARHLEVKQTIKVLEARVAAAEAEAASARKAYASAKTSAVVSGNGKGRHQPANQPGVADRQASVGVLGAQRGEPSRPTASRAVVAATHDAGGLGPLIVPKASAVVQARAAQRLGEMLAAGSKPKPRISVSESDFQGWGHWSDDFGAVATLLWKKRQFQAHSVNGRVEPKKQAEILAWFKAANSLRRLPPGYEAWELSPEEQAIAQKGISGIRYKLKLGKGKTSQAAATTAFSSRHPLDREIAVKTLTSAREARGHKVDEDRIKRSTTTQLVQLAQTSQVGFNDTIQVAFFDNVDKELEAQNSVPAYSWDDKVGFTGPVVDLSRRNLKSKVSSVYDIVDDDLLDDEDIMPLIIDSSETDSMASPPFVMPELNPRTAPEDVDEATFAQELAKVGQRQVDGDNHRALLCMCDTSPCACDDYSAPPDLYVDQATTKALTRGRRLSL